MGKKEHKSLKIYQNPSFYLGVLILASIVAFYFFRIPLILVLTTCFGLILFVLLKDRCKQCHRPLALRHWKKEQVSMSLKPHHYIIETRCLYSNGEYSHSEHSEQKTIQERIAKYSYTSNCHFCNHEHVKFKEKNLDKDSRPEIVIEVLTSAKCPRVCIMCGATLRSRRKYCSSCRPSGRRNPYGSERVYRNSVRRKHPVATGMMKAFLPRQVTKDFF